MDILLIGGQIMYGGFFVLSGLKHFTRLEAMASYAKAKHVPAPKFAVAASGLLIVLGGLGVLFGVYVRIALLLIIIFLIPVTLQMHAFWSDTDPGTKAANQINFMKNMALLGAALMLFAILAP